MDKNFQILNDTQNSEVLGGSLYSEKDWLANAMNFDSKIMSPANANGINSKKATCILCKKEFLYWCNTSTKNYECTYDLWRGKVCLKCIKKHKVY